MNIPQGYLHTHISWFQKNTFSKYCHLHSDIPEATIQFKQGENNAAVFWLMELKTKS
jgi:hypothetical protein